MKKNSPLQVKSKLAVNLAISSFLTTSLVAMGFLALRPGPSVPTPETMDRLTASLAVADPLKMFVSDGFTTSERVSYRSGLEMIQGDFHQSLRAYVEGRGSIEHMASLITTIVSRPIQANEMEQVLLRLAETDPALEKAFGEDGPLAYEILARDIADEANRLRFGPTYLADWQID